MSEGFQYEQILQFCRLLFEGQPSATLATQEGLPIFVKYENLAEIGSLPVVAQTTQQYLNLQDGEISITNDPYSGGTILTNFYLSLGLASEQKRGKNSDLVLITKISLKPRVSHGDNIDNEGVRIPPTPITANKKINHDVLKAISSHPQAPTEFEQQILRGIKEIESLKTRFMKLNEIFQLDWSKPYLKQYFKDSSSQMSNLLSNFSSGERSEELELNDGSLLKLRVEVRDDKVIFDFSGSDNSKSVQLTHSAALGGCTGALISLFDKNLPISQGIFECIEVIAPEGSLVHAKFPKPVYFGMTDGVSAIANLVLKAIGNLDKSKRYPLSGTSYCSFNIEFSNCHFFETLEPGSAASKSAEGFSGVNIWKRSSLEPSIEEIERRFPITVETYSFRSNSGGDGKFNGGCGVVKAYQVLENCKFVWSINEPSEKPLGVMGGRDAQSAEILLQRHGKEKQVLAKAGSIELHQSDKIIIQSAGGGGFGETDDGA